MRAFPVIILFEFEVTLCIQRVLSELVVMSRLSTSCKLPGNAFDTKFSQI